MPLDTAIHSFIYNKTSITTVKTQWINTHKLLNINNKIKILHQSDAIPTHANSS